MQNLALVLAIIVMTGWFAGLIYPAAIGFRGTKRSTVCMWGFGATLLAVTLARSVPSGMSDISDTTAGLIILPLLIGWPAWAAIKLIRNVIASRRPASALTEAAPVPQPVMPVTASTTEPSQPSVQKQSRDDPVQVRLDDEPYAEVRSYLTPVEVVTAEFTYNDQPVVSGRFTVIVDAATPKYFSGYCFEAKRERIFRLDRVKGKVRLLDDDALLSVDVFQAMFLTAKPPAVKVKTKPAKRTTSRAMDSRWSRGTISFEYVDAKGDWSMRTVSVHSVSSTRIKGECHACREERTFLLDRIEGDIVNLETGEVLDPQEWAAQHA